jgi:hypothetical protein
VKQTKVVAWKYLPTRPPLAANVLWWLFLDRMGAPSWAWGVFWTLFALLWIGSILAIYYNDHVNPFDAKNIEVKTAKESAKP